MTTYIPQSWYKRLRVTFILFGISIIVSGSVYFILNQRQEHDRASANLTAFSHNSIVCVTRPYLFSSRARAEQIVSDPTKSDSDKARARQAIVSTTTFLNGLITIPGNYDCGPLLKRLREEALHG